MMRPWLPTLRGQRVQIAAPKVDEHLFVARTHGIDACRPRLADLHPREGGAGERHVLHEIDRFDLPFLRVAFVPEPVHLQADGNEEGDDGGETLTRFDAGHDAEPT